MDKKVLLVDDDIELCTLLKKCLDSVNINVTTANSGAKGMVLLNEDTYHLIGLDVMLPDLSGFSILQHIRKNSSIPILMLTAKNEEDDKVKGLELGADDYLTKPFGIREFIARVNSLIRRNTVFNSSASTNKCLSFKGLTIDTEKRTVYVDNQLVALSAREFDLLCFLASNKGRIFTRTQLYEQLWNDECVFDDSNVMSFISKLRKKIECNPNNPEYIQTVRGIGYRFNEEA